ncbi:protein FAR1-RELATED SEQUENCE 5-like [Castanea sativa]|uniref:protein FAR1-RELATED SEQUENCE 5-like n=1 Tax=Castanea sativa TaxID=21020 RepID=UPI003F64DA8B
MRHFLRSHKQDFDPSKSLSHSCSSPGMGLSDPVNVLINDSNGFDKLVFTAQNSVNYIGRGRLSTFGIDAQSLLKFFKVDEEDRLSSVFWVDTRSRIAYNRFSDVVAFDTAYQVNQYKMPFARFTGVNHHKQSLLFGCTLLADETESTFIWLFTTWLEAMSGQQPGLIITDYDSAIGRAVELVFPQSRHRYCKWHIMSKMPREMGDTYSSLPRTFQVEFDRCINKSETPDKFESAWPVLLDKYNLRGNEWLQLLYIDRKMWVPTYVRDTFFAGMYATQQSTSVNSLFDGYVNARTTLQDFAEQYEKALDDRYEKEARAEFETFYTKPVLKTPLPMEKQAADIYTRQFFIIFQEEVFESLALAVKFTGEDGGRGTYEVARFDEEHKCFFVCFNIAEQIASCSCKMFEFEGVLCRHVLAVFKAKNVFMLPHHYISKRWTRNAKDEAILDVQVHGEMQGKSQKGTKLQYSILYQEAIKCAEEGMTSDHSFRLALNVLREARIKIVDAKKDAINPKKLETMASASYQDENTTTASHVDSSSAPINPLENLKTKTRDSSRENNILASEQSSSRVTLCTSGKCPGHDSTICLWLKDSSQHTSLDNQNQKIAYTTSSCG